MSVVFPEIEKARALLRELKCPHWVAGGWAIDMYLGRQTRAHKDIEFAIDRADQQHLMPLPNLGGIEYVEDHERKTWRGHKLELPVHELHAWFYGRTEVEFLLNEFEGDDWVYRRNKAIRLPRARFGDAPFLPPEIVLLYKSKNPRAEDEQDFNAALEQLETEQRFWLESAIAKDYPAHPWLVKLRGGARALSDAARGKF